MTKSWKPDPQNWASRYKRDGYLVVENALDPDTLERMRLALERVENDVRNNSLPPHLRSLVSLERDRSKGQRLGESLSEEISVIMELPLFDPIFKQIIIYPRVLDALEVLFASSEFTFHNYKAIFKMPNGEAPFRWHRDLPYLQHTSPNLITCMLCIDPMMKENGATVVCPGSHNVPHEAVKPEDVDMPIEEIPANRVTVACPAGSLVLFHVNIIHGGGPNLSQIKRRNVIGIWAGPNNYPVTGHRYAYEFVAPRSVDPERQKQIAMAFGQKQ